MPKLLPIPLPIVATEEDIEHFTLGDMFPAGHGFALHHGLRTLTHLSLEPDGPFSEDARPDAI